MESYPQYLNKTMRRTKHITQQNKNSRHNSSDVVKECWYFFDVNLYKMLNNALLAGD